MSSDYNIEMSTDDTLELDAIIQEWDAESNGVIGKILYEDSDSTFHNLTGIQTNTAIFDPQKAGKYTIPVNGQELTVNVTKASAIPDSDLTQYALTDPDNEVTVSSSTSWEAGFGSNDVSRLYKNIEIESLTHKFRVERLDGANNEGEEITIGWANQADTTRDSVSAVIGCWLVNDDIEVAQNGADVTQKRVVVASFNNGDVRDVEVDYDVSNATVTLTAFDTGGTQLGSETINYDDTKTYNQHYALMAAGQNLGYPGSMDVDLTNNDFDPL